MYFLYTLLQALDRDADLDDPDSIDELFNNDDLKVIRN